MIIKIAQVSLVVRDYEEAKNFYCKKLGFLVAEETHLEKKSWIRLRAPGNQGTEIILSKAVDEMQRAAIGNQAGGRVLFFMETDNFNSDYEKLLEAGIEFSEKPRSESYGKVAVFKDLYGNRIDLIQSSGLQKNTNEEEILVSDNKELLNVDVVHGFLKRSSWAASRTRETLIKSIQNSYCFGAYKSGKQIGFARVVSDGCTFSYLCDVFVDEACRGIGVSKRLMAAILAHPDLQSFRRFTLATKDAHGLYSKFGFQPVELNRFMEIKNDNV